MNTSSIFFSYAGILLDPTPLLSESSEEEEPWIPDSPENQQGLTELYDDEEWFIQNTPPDFYTLIGSNEGSFAGERDTLNVFKYGKVCDKQTEKQ